MKIVFHPKYYESGYADDPAAQQGRLESITGELKGAPNVIFIEPSPASIQDIERCHTSELIAKELSDEKRFAMAMLSAGGAIAAAESCMSGEPAFACIRPPGHHAYRTMNWGYCVFCNIAVALLKLRDQGTIRSAFILDFDAHTGDGTIDVMSDWKECIILNPMADTRGEYMRTIEKKIDSIRSADIIGVSAGFDSYIKDVGKKLETFDYYQIGFLMKQLSKRLGHLRRFAVLEGGYYLPDLGRNVLAFCEGLE